MGGRNGTLPNQPTHDIQMPERDPISLKIGTYNFKHGVMAGFNMGKIAENILSTNLDIVGVREVDQKTSRV